MSSYTLVSSERSPFGRICRMFMIANKLEFDFRVLNFVDSKEDAETLAKETPINRVPFLVVDGAKLFDSRVIINYLIAKHSLKKISFEEENILSMVYSCMDASVTLLLMGKSGYDLSAHNFYLDRQKQRIVRNLEHVSPWAATLQPLKDWDYASMTLYSFLYWADRRAKTIQIDHYPHFKKFISDFASAPGVKESESKI